jgi:hypothetical protein
MTRKQVVLAAVVVCLSAGVAWAATGSTSITMNSVTKVGGQNGPWTISAGGDCSIDSTVTGWAGLQFSVTDPNNKLLTGSQTYRTEAPNPEALLYRGLDRLAVSRCKATIRWSVPCLT